MRIHFICLFTLLFSLCTIATAQIPQTDNFQTIVERYRELLLRSSVPDADKMRSYVANLGADGRWPDIDYADESRSGWKVSDHLSRVRELSRALVAELSALHDDAATEAAIIRALDHWIAQRYRNPNWWHNDIGVPMMMRDIIVLLGPRLQGTRRAGALEVLHQYGKAKAGDGANTMWLAELALIYGALTRDGDLVEQNSKLISDEIHVSKGEGIQSDGSYHQHGARLQQFHYGSAFLNDAARLGWQLRATPWAIPTAKLQIVADAILNGSQWMVRGISTVPGTLDRSVSRDKALKGGDLRGAARFLREALPQSAPQLDALIARQDGTGAPLDGFRFYPRSDFAAYQRPAFSFFLKTISNRTATTESINSENLKGHLLNSGDAYVMRDGEEYASLPPVWNWEFLPGVTYAQSAGEVQRQPFSGGVTDGQSGAVAMDYRFGDKDKTVISTRKMWAFHGDIVVALIGAVQNSNADEPVRTALDQALLRGPVTVSDAQNKVQILAAGQRATGDWRWVQHSGLMYFVPPNSQLTVQSGLVSGSWSQINKGGATTPITQPVFLPILEHRTKEATWYAISPAATPQRAAQIAARPGFKVLLNEADIQAVRFDDGTVIATFYASGALDDLKVDAPCLALQNAAGLWLSDPTQKGGNVQVTRHGKTIAIELPNDGSSVKVAE